jgi:hypothetical protein
VITLLTELLRRHGAADPGGLARALVAAVLVMRSAPPVVLAQSPVYPAHSSPALVPGDDGLPSDPELRVVLTGGFGRDDFHGLVLQKGTRVESFRLSRPEFVFLVVLACLARSNARLPAPFPVVGGLFLPPRQIIKVLDDRQRADPKLSGAFDNATEDSVYRWVHQVRTRLKDAAFAPGMIESGGARKGFRLAAFPRNIFIHLQ